jgi:protein-L-isoaspartate(D-aspartate) O-methyltransferase
MIDRRQYTPDGSNPPFPVPINDLCTVPTEEMAMLLANLVLGENPEAAKLKDILEIGTGSGYQAAILAERCRSLVSIDVCLNRALEEKLPSHVALVVANGYEYDTEEQFDGVLVTFGAHAIAASWGWQLKEGARLVVPLLRGSGSAISVYARIGDQLALLEVVAYAPFTKGVEA